MRVMKGERGNIGIFILTLLMVTLLVGFFLWSIFPEPWREFLLNGPWGIVVVVLAGFIIVVSIVRGERARREHKRAHDRVAKVFREATDPALQKRAALWLVDQDRSEEHTSELQSRLHLVCRLLLEKKKNNNDALPIRHACQYAPIPLTIARLSATRDRQHRYSASSSAFCSAHLYNPRDLRSLSDTSSMLLLLSTPAVVA